MAGGVAIHVAVCVCLESVVFPGILSPVIIRCALSDGFMLLLQKLNGNRSGR